METRKKICRFCLENCDTNFKAIERSTHETLNMLLVTMDLAISDEPVMCTNCSEVLQKCFVFKKTCLDIRGRSEAFSSDQKKGHAVCDLCMNLLKKCSLTALDIEEDLISKKTMLEKHFPELGAIKKPIVCEACHGSLVTFLNFITISSIVEEKIKEYRDTEDVKATQPIKLYKVVQFTSENVWNENDIFKMEDTVSIKSEEEKMEIQGEMCTLCMEKSETTKNIDENMRNILNIVLPQIEYTVIRGPVMCKSCEEVLTKCFEFKATCLHTHNYYMVPFLDNKDRVKLELKDVYPSKNATRTDVPEDEDLCGLCMGLVKNRSAVSLDVDEGDVTLEIMMKQCLPELDLSIIKKPVICAPCHGSLERCFYFVKNCLIIGEKIKKHCVTPDINNEGQIELSTSSQFTIKDVTKKYVDDYWADKIKVEEQFVDEREIDNGKDAIKLESVFFDDSENSVVGVENKNRSFMEINDGEVDNAQQFTPENKGACAGENNKLGSVKIEEILCGENETKHKEENLVEMEDHKFLFNEEIEIKTDEHDFDRFENGIVLTQSEVTRGIHRRKECAALNLERDAHIQLPLTKKNVSNIGMYQHDFHSFQTKHEKSLVNNYSTLEGFKKRVPVHEDSSEVTMYSCDLRSFHTRNEYNLDKHLLTHKDTSELTMYKCDSCSYQTKRKEHLKRHLLQHKDPSEITMYKCDSCSFQTKHKCSLKTHLLRHNKDSLEVTMYECDSCSHQTKHKNDLKIHLLQHKDPLEIAVYKCDSCSFQTRHRYSLKMHLLRHKDPSEITMYKCDFCSHQTKHKNDLKIHLLRHKNPSEVTMYKCDSCLYETKSKAYLRKHLLQHKNTSEVTMYKCDLCPFQTRHKHSIKMHLLRHKDPSELKLYKCDSCSHQTKHKNDLKIHLLQHKNPSEITMYKCDSCLYQTKTKAYLRKHLLQHKNPSEITMYKCDFCSFQTKRKGYLKTHMLQHKNLSEVPVYKCDSCLFQTKHRGSLRKHLLIHRDPSNVTMYKCESCLFQTKRKQNLEIHLLRHKDPSEITMYKCDSCSHQTKHKNDLKIHLLQHKDPSEVTMYKCDSCLFQTKHKQNLKIHLQEHKDPSEVTMYKCDSCLFQTKRKQNLKIHLLRHKDPSGVTMYKCDSCLYQTTCKDIYKTHLLKHKNPSEVRMYKCETCSFLTKYHKSLERHMLKHRDVQM